VSARKINLQEPTVLQRWGPTLLIILLFLAWKVLRSLLFHRQSSSRPIRTVSTADTVASTAHISTPVRSNASEQRDPATSTLASIGQDVCELCDPQNLETSPNHANTTTSKARAKIDSTHRRCLSYGDDSAWNTRMAL